MFFGMRPGGINHYTHLDNLKKNPSICCDKSRRICPSKVYINQLIKTNM